MLTQQFPLKRVTAQTSESETTERASRGAHTLIMSLVMKSKNDGLHPSNVKTAALIQMEMEAYCNHLRDF